MAQALDKEQAWAIINGKLEELTLSHDASVRMEKLIDRGIGNLEPSRSQEAVANLQLFADKLTLQVRGMTSPVGVEDVEVVLRELCPLFPFC